MSTKQIFLWALGLSSASACLGYWMSGVIGGFRLWDKLPDKIKKAWRVYAALSLLGGGGMVGAASMRGCAVLAGAAAQSASLSASLSPQPQRRLAVNLISPLDVLGALKRERVREEAEQKRKAAAEQRKAEAERRKQERAERRQAQLDLMVNSWPSNIVMSSNSTSGGVVMMGVPPSYQKAGSRKGPFCRVTCTFHHGSTGDVEVEKHFCESSSIPVDAQEVLGWVRQGEYEFLNPWPGPVNKGFESYKLYWKDTP